MGVVTYKDEGESIIEDLTEEYGYYFLEFPDMVIPFISSYGYPMSFDYAEEDFDTIVRNLRDLRVPESAIPVFVHRAVATRKVVTVGPWGS